MAKTGLDARVVVNETLLTSVAGKWFAFAKDIEKKNLGEAEASYEELLNAIDVLEFELSQVVARLHTAQYDLQALTDQLMTLKSLIEQGSGRIATLRQELAVARQDRKRQEEYDAIAATILKQHDRTSVAKEIKALQEEIEHERLDKVKHDRLLELRSKQFHLLLTTIEDLEDELQDRDDAEDEDAMVPE
nr:THO complex subunit 7 [Euglena gracilis]